MHQQPNIIFVLTDDQGYGDLGCGDNPIIRTPHIDHFHTESVRLTNFHVGPTCAPTRAGLMTGHYANSTGVWHTIGGRSLLRQNEWTLAQALRDNGYATGIFGKWHLGDAHPYRPMDRGFDVSVVHGGGGIMQTPDYWGNDYFDDTYFVNGQPQAFEGYCTDVFFREGMQFIETHRDQPFFCYIATNAPHMPYNVDNHYADHYRGVVDEDRARFYGMIENIDENFGKLRDALDQWELTDNTILIFMTDNGTSGGLATDSREFGIHGYNMGMRGIKNSAYDGGHRVPFFIRWPNSTLQHGQDIQHITSHVDFMPTLLDLCGVDPGDHSFHGQSLKPLMDGHDDDWPERTLVTDSQRNAYPAKWRKSAVMTDHWRLINGHELYDMTQDPGQRDNIAAHHPDVVSQLRSAYEDWWQLVSVQYDDTVPMMIGSQPTDFTSHDMRNDECDVAWDQIYIRIGHITHGYWEVEVAEDGMYRITTRRWPASEDRPIQGGIEGQDVAFRKDAIHEKEHRRFYNGRALDIQRAHIAIQGQQMQQDLTPEMTAAPFTLHLHKGQTTLEAWYEGDSGIDTTAAYYIHVEKVDIDPS